jgi:glutathione S-transferase
VTFIYHIAARPDWEEALRLGQYTGSTRGRTLAEEGFIHCSQAAQVAHVANLFFRGDTDLVLLVIDPGKVASEIRHERVPGSETPFPHIYGPLGTSAVIGVLPLVADPDGSFTFAPER